MSGDLAAYTDQSVVPQIRYYNFATSIDTAISNVMPDGTFAVDLLSDVNGANVAFTRQSGGASRIMIFNTTTSSITEVDPVSGPTPPQRMGVALGANTAAYIDISGTGDVIAWDMATSTRQVVSAAPAFESNPNVSPDGKVIVWEYCVSSISNCDAYQAVNTAGSWVVSATANTANPEANPDTDGTTIAFDADRAGSATGQDIFLRAVSGGAETQIQLPGLQRNPSISGGVVAFESIAPGDTNADIFVYIIATNTLLQITATPGNETLNDVTVLGNGNVRLVWAANDVDVVGTTFTPPSSGTGGGAGGGSAGGAGGGSAGGAGGAGGGSAGGAGGECHHDDDHDGHHDDDHDGHHDDDHGGHHGHGNHGGDQGESKHGLEATPDGGAPTAMGCSASGNNGLLGLGLVAAALMLLARRPTAQRVPVRASRTRR